MIRDPFEQPDDELPPHEESADDEPDWRDSESPIVRDLLRAVSDEEELKPCTRPNCRGCGCGMPLAKHEVTVTVEIVDPDNEPPF